MSRQISHAMKPLNVERLSGHLAEGLRLSLLVGDQAIEESSDGPGMLVVDRELKPVVITPAAERWLEQIAATPGQEHSIGSLPDVVYPVVARLRALETEDNPADVMPRSRLRTSSGRWLVVHASRLSGSDSAGKTAIIIEEARPQEIAALIVQAYALSARERELTQLVLRGISTAEIAAELNLSTNTVQDTSRVRSRRELVASIWSRQYWPRIAAGAPLRSDGCFAEAALG